MKTRLSAWAAETASSSAQIRNASKMNASESRIGNTGEGIEGPRSTDRPQKLIMINHDCPGLTERREAAESAAKEAQPRLDAVPRAGTSWNHERSPRHLRHLPRDY